MNKLGTTLLFASHTLLEVEQLATRMALLHKGRLLAYDTPERFRSAAGCETLEPSIETYVRRAELAS